MHSIITTIFDHISFPLSIDKLIELKSDSEPKKDKENKPNNQKKTKRIKLTSTHILFALFVIFSSDPCQNKHTSIDNSQAIYMRIQSELVLSNFNGFYWEYTSEKNIKNAKDLSSDDYEALRSKLWEIIKKTRRDFSELPNGLELMNKVGDVYNHDDYCTDFDFFIENKKSESLLDLRDEFVLYMKNIQGKISDKVFRF